MNEFDAMPLLLFRKGRQMRIFRYGASKIVPHAGDDAFDLFLADFRHGNGDIAPGFRGYAQPRSDRAAKPPAEARGAINRHRTEKSDGEPQRRIFRQMFCFALDGHARRIFLFVPR